MARLVIGAMFGIVVGVVAGAALGLRAEDPKTDVAEAAEAAGVDAQDLAGAVNTVGVDPFTYLRSVGELPPLPVPREPAIPPPVVAYNARVECIISKESGGANVANRLGSGAVGVAQYMPSTFAAHAREMGHPDWSPWNPLQARAVAAHDLALGRRSQWTVGGC
jgi:Transglycosylase SLT domain